MDFLEIRKKAKERAAARGAGASPEAPFAPSPPPPPDLAEAPRSEVEVVAGLARRLQTVPARDRSPFTTWRPGAAAPPVPLAAGAAAAPAAADTASPPSAARAGPRTSALDEFFYRPDEDAPSLPGLADAEAVAAAGEVESAPLEEFLTFLLGGEEYAVAIGRVREVLKAPPITEVPRAPAHILGVVTVRGEVVAVVDPRLRLGLPPGAPAPGNGRIVLVDAGVGMGTCGLLVDRVATVARLKPGSVEPCPQGIAGAHGDCLAGIGRERDRLFSVLDLGALLRRSPAAGRAASAGGRDVGA
jgi:purine-binding chemotaxis protein CheW